MPLPQTLTLTPGNGSGYGCRHAQLCEVISHAAMWHQNAVVACLSLSLKSATVEPVACRTALASCDSKQLATCLKVSAATVAAVGAVAAAAAGALLGVYLIFHMPPQLLPPRRLLTGGSSLHRTGTLRYVNCLHKWPGRCAAQGAVCPLP